MQTHDGPEDAVAEPAGASSREGVLFLVVGPSGVGKDSLIDGARARLPQRHFSLAQRVVTRPREAGGEDHEPMDLTTFRAEEAAGAFAVAWGAHGLRYGIRHRAIAPLAQGSNVIVNASRGSIGAFATLARRVVVISVVAPPEIVRARLEARGREDAADVAARLERRVPLVGAGNVAVIDNGGALEVGVDHFVAALLGAARLPLAVHRVPVTLPGGPVAFVHRAALPLASQQVAAGGGTEVVADSAVRVRLAVTDGPLVDPASVGLPDAVFDRLGAAEGSEVVLRRAAPPVSRDALRRKIAGDTLGAGAIATIVRDIVDGRYSEAEVAGFLVAASRQLTVTEIAALTKERAGLVVPIAWDRRLVVDKHSLGGVPGNPISLVVVPVVAAHGLPIPKTSSRAITSAAGTADIMECAARVDLDAADLKRVVSTAGGAVAWAGRISHSPLDDVMNAINRPLGIASPGLDVSSILSKKLAVGATHVAIDIPVGPAAKVKTAEAGAELARLFEEVGRAVGLTVRAAISDGRHPLGRGVGPALELEDALAILSGAPEACAALRAKAVNVAGTILEWDPAVREGEGPATAARLLASGAALDAFRAIVAAQGPVERLAPGPFTRPLLAPRAGRVADIDVFAVAGLARAVGAPLDKGAGVRLTVRVGDEVAAGDVLADVVASSQNGIDAIRADASGELFTLA
ncbi:phosphonate metabolism protein/1,5-bisphosphokinase (PRPP-forming) PhnN [Acuticoccus sp. I52.16.1]|uniref:phosphonate metabolism protein/1,5-bisphosphokinase (PRPP-forming) PhnN n=1 Tax=Acuticoccus sp. I52.16.1 TaxID=2928472 RepID=UPI001FD3DBE8|nr:phosphonate metabolism protein/1,5-bisphosphokinase (PRPP-forming) PhnN [Acuticoccus sp. I52.16.1]UOM33185.1 phosphonate metabolism protein/1,5-bisphosphokinase (PRPP-forming) PhnN [Acuticoccus sp. I52.16.1]